MVRCLLYVPLLRSNVQFPCIIRKYGRGCHEAVPDQRRLSRYANISLKTMYCSAWMSRSRFPQGVVHNQARHRSSRRSFCVPDKAFGIQTMLHAMLQRSSSRFRSPATPPRTLCKYSENTILGRCLLLVVWGKRAV